MAQRTDYSDAQYAFLPNGQKEGATGFVLALSREIPVIDEVELRLIRDSLFRLSKENPSCACFLYLPTLHSVVPGIISRLIELKESCQREVYLIGIKSSVEPNMLMMLNCLECKSPVRGERDFQIVLDASERDHPEAAIESTIRRLELVARDFEVDHLVWQKFDSQVVDSEEEVDDDELEYPQGPKSASRKKATKEAATKKGKAAKKPTKKAPKKK